MQQTTYNEILKREISNHFKLVEYVRVESDFTQDSISTGEVSKISYAPILNRKDSYFENKRSIITVFIRFTDNTAMKMNLNPEDYLGRAHEKESKIKYFDGVVNLYTSRERQYDINKVLKTILTTLKGEKIENPTLQTLDYLPI